MAAPQPGCCPDCARYGLTGVRVQDGMCAFGHRPRPVPGDVPWGIAELAEHRGVKRATLDSQRATGRAGVPDPDGTVSGRPYWWRSKIMEGPRMNARDKLAAQLTEAVMARLREADGGWVPYSDLLAMAPEGRNVVISELEGEEPFGADYAAGSAWDSGPSGKPDGGMLADCLRHIEGLLKGQPQRLDEGYPGGAERSFRLVTSPVLNLGDVIILPQGMSYEGERAELAEHLIDGGPDRWRARVMMPGTPHDGEFVTIARGWAEAAEVVR